MDLNAYQGRSERTENIIISERMGRRIGGTAPVEIGAIEAPVRNIDIFRELLFEDRHVSGQVTNARSSLV